MMLLLASVAFAGEGQVRVTGGGETTINDAFVTQRALRGSVDLGVSGGLDVGVSAALYGQPEWSRLATSLLEDDIAADAAVMRDHLSLVARVTPFRSDFGQVSTELSAHAGVGVIRTRDLPADAGGPGDEAPMGLQTHVAGYFGFSNTALFGRFGGRFRLDATRWIEQFDSATDSGRRPVSAGFDLVFLVLP